jgi:hypothetical protein
MSVSEFDDLCGRRTGLGVKDDRTSAAIRAALVEREELMRMVEVISGKFDCSVERLRQALDKIDVAEKT